MTESKICHACRHDGRPDELCQVQGKTTYSPRYFCFQKQKKTFITSGFWPRVRARALHAPVFVSS